MDCKWSNLNVAGSHTPCSHSLLKSIVGCLFPLHTGKGKGASGFCISGNLPMENRFNRLQVVQFECGRVTHPLVSFTLKTGVGWMPFPLHAGKGNCASGFSKSGNLPMDNRFNGLQVVQFECGRAIHPLVSFTLKTGVGWMPFSLHAGKGNCASGL